ncbi:DUF6932 family protein [Citricoccus parietis]|uniref:DUF6932 family protein n=2 Tax=Citricoccus parietis TaxID=592307 RepID=A0ABV5G677_9MICC
MSWAPPWSDIGGDHRALAPGCYRIEWDDFKSCFAASDQPERSSQLQDLADYLELLKGHGLVIPHVLVDGSFTTTKRVPADIDVSPVMDYEASRPDAEIAKHAHANFIHPKDRYKTTPVPGLGRTVSLDIYGFVIVSPGHTHFDHCQTNEMYWREWWQRSRTSGMATKGYLEVKLP